MKKTGLTGWTICALFAMALSTACSSGGGSDTDSANSSTDTSTQSSDNTATSDSDSSDVTGTTDSPKILVSWSPPSARENGQSITTDNLLGYQLQYYKEGDDPNDPVVVGMDELTNDLTSYETPLLSPGTWYFSIRAVGADGFEGDFSPAIDVTVQSN